MTVSRRRLRQQQPLLSAMTLPGSDDIRREKGKRERKRLCQMGRSRSKHLGTATSEGEGEGERRQGGWK